MAFEDDDLRAMEDAAPASSPAGGAVCDICGGTGLTRRGFPCVCPLGDGKPFPAPSPAANMSGPLSLDEALTALASMGGTLSREREEVAFWKGEHAHAVETRHGLSERVAALEAALGKAAEVFDMYAVTDDAIGTLGSRARAIAHRRHAADCRRALAGPEALDPGLTESRRWPS